MKIRAKNNSGNVLFATLFTTGIICLYMGSYLSLVRSENQTTKRSQTWNMAIPVAEAGIEEALAYLHSTFPEVKPDGKKWTGENGGNYITKTNSLNPDEYYKVGIFPPSSANGTKTPIIVSEGFVRLPLSTNFVSRTVLVNTKLDGGLMRGMIVVTSAKMNGNKLAIDSFNSTNSAFSTDGKYDKNKRGDKALLATLSAATNINLGNADVWGKVAGAYSGVPPKVGEQSTVGSTQWHLGNNKGIESGAYTDDVNMSVETPTAPFTSALAPASLLGVTVLGTGDYAVENLSGTVIVTGKARLLVTKTFNVTSLTISNLTASASLELYVAAPDVDISKGILNVQGRASNFKYFGLPANPSLNWPGNKTLTAGGNGQFTAMVNAPETVLTLRGGGRANTPEDFSGSCLVNSVAMNGHYNFHFDESCEEEMPQGFITISWDEINVDWETILAKNLSVKQLY